MTKTNHLGSHTGESSSSRVDKMSGMGKELKKMWVGHSKVFVKKFYSKKRRQILNQNDEEKI